MKKSVCKTKSRKRDSLKKKHYNKDGDCQKKKHYYKEDDCTEDKYYHEEDDCHEENDCREEDDCHEEKCHKEEYDSYNYSDYNNADVIQEGDQSSINEQDSIELIWIKESCNVKVHTTDTQAAVSLQVGLQLAIALVVSITIGDTDRSKAVSQELFQQFHAEQTNFQKVIIKNSKDVDVTTTDTDLAVNIQALLQILVAIVAKLDVL